MIGFYLDKKLKNEVVRKAEKVLNINRNTKLVENRSIKRIFASRDCKGITALSEMDKRTIASGIVDKMTNMRDNPLLLQIEHERQKVERQLKLAERRQRPIGDVPRKYKKEDEHILIRNNQGR